MSQSKQQRRRSLKRSTTQIIICCLMMSIGVLAQPEPASAQLYVCPSGATESASSDTGCARWTGSQWVPVAAVPQGTTSSTLPSTRQNQNTSMNCSFSANTSKSGELVTNQWTVRCTGISYHPIFGVKIFLNDHGSTYNLNNTRVACNPDCEIPTLYNSGDGDGIKSSTISTSFATTHVVRQGTCATFDRYLSALVHLTESFEPVRVDNPQRVSAAACVTGPPCPSGYTSYNATWCSRSVTACPTGYQYYSWGCYGWNNPPQDRFRSHITQVSYAMKR